MSYYDEYISRVNQIGSSDKEAFINIAKEYSLEKFNDSPYYRQVDINGAPMDVRLVQKTKYNERAILFKPDTVIDIGSYVKWGDQTWLMMDFFVNEIYPKSTAHLCNEVLKWKTKDGIPKEYPCSISTSRGIMDAQGNSFDIQLPDGTLMMDVQMNVDTKSIPLSLRLILNGRVYKITGIDNVSQSVLGKGTLRFTVETDTVANAADDFVNGYASNNMLYGGASADTPPSTDGDQLW